MELKQCIHISDLHEEPMYRIVKDFCKNNPVIKYNILFITGDLTYRGSFAAFTKAKEQMDLILEKELVEDIVWIPGNHDMSLEKGHIAHENVMALFKDQPHIHLLNHEYKEVQELRIFGSPWTPWFYDWAFNYYNPQYPHEAANGVKGEELWAKIPENTQILLTHGPPNGILDVVVRNNTHVGCPALMNKIIELDKKDLRFHLFGHIHETYGRSRVGNIHFLNSSIMTVHYIPKNKPQDFEIWTEEP